jgi:hypothetical protein
MKRIASFDIGKNNFAFIILEYDSEILESIEETANKYNPNGTCTEEMEQVLSQIYCNTSIVLHEITNLTDNCNDKKTLDPESFHNMTDFLNKRKKYWDTCDYFVIEEQMSFGRKINRMALKLGQHCYSYFAINYMREKVYIEYPSYYKTQILGAPKVNGKPYKSGKVRFKSMGDKERKKWSIEKVTTILTEMKESKALELIQKKRKQDDMCDCLLQAYACLYHIHIEGLY